MKGNKLLWGLVFAGVFILVSSIIGGRAVIYECEKAGGRYGTGRVVVSPADIRNAKEMDSFSLDDIKNLRKILNTDDITYESYCRKDITGGMKKITANLYGVDYMFRYFENIRLKYGNFFCSGTDNEKSGSVVIYDDTANKLFGGDDVVGLNIDISGKKFKISGVAIRDSSAFNAFPKTLKPEILMQASELNDLDRNVSINILQFGTADRGTDGKVKRDIKGALGSIGKNDKDYNIDDYNTRRVELEARPYAVVWCAGAVCIIIMLRFIWENIKMFRSFIILEKGRCYLRELLVSFIKKYWKYVLMILASLSVITVLLRKMAFQIYIAPENIPDEIFDFSFYSNLIKNNILDNLAGIGLSGSMYGIRVRQALMILNIMFLCSVFIAMPMVYTVLNCIIKKRTPADRAAVLTGIMFALSVVIVTLVCIKSGMAVKVDTAGLMVVFLSIWMTMTASAKERCSLPKQHQNLTELQIDK